MLTTLLLSTAPLLSSTNPSLPEADPGVTRLLQAQAQGRSNAFDDLWLLPFDVPGNEKARIATADVERINAQLRSVEATGTTAQPASAMRSLASEHYPPSPIPSSDAPPLCDLQGDDCLTRVRAAPEAYTALLTQEAALLSRHNALARHDHFHSRFSAHPRSPSLPLTRMSLPLTDAALKFVQGRTEDALQSVCEHTQAWRRIGANSDSMVVSMLATALVNGNASLYAQMRVELPADHSEPAACAAAFTAPSAEELSLCTAMTGEYALHKHTTESQLAQRESAKPGALESATVDPARTLDLTARQLGRQCSDEVLAQLRDDVRVQLPPVDIDLTSPECVANPVGCRGCRQRGLRQLHPSASGHGRPTASGRDRVPTARRLQRRTGSRLCGPHERGFANTSGHAVTRRHRLAHRLVRLAPRLSRVGRPARRPAATVIGYCCPSLGSGTSPSTGNSGVPSTRGRICQAM